MNTKTTFIDAGHQDTSRPKDRAPKSNRKLEFIKKSLKVIQHVSPAFAAKVIWNFFTTPGKPKFSENQLEFLGKAHHMDFQYRGCTIKAYSWGEGRRKILLAHGWRSKSADFRKMVEALVEEGFQVHGVDMKAHGNSEGKASALPEFRDILDHMVHAHGPYYAIVGYSLGGIATGVVLERLVHLPEKVFIISSPPFVRYFFKDTVMRDVGCNERVYEAMSGMVQKYYGEPIEYFDLRIKALDKVELHLMYDEDDQVVPMERGLELKEAHPQAHWVQSKGLGHYKIIAHPEIIKYLVRNLEVKKHELVS